MGTYPISLARKSPIAARTLVVLALLGRPAVAEPIDEAVVIRRVRASDPAVAAAQRSVDLARAREIGRGLHPNPGLGLERETLGAGAEDTLSLSVPLDLSGRRGAARALARADTAAARSGAARAERGAVERALLLFYDAVAAGEEVAIARRVAAGLDEAARVVRHRRSAGNASGYEEVRLEVEAELARSELAEAEARAERRRRELAMLLGMEDVELAGTLEPPISARRRGRARSVQLLSGSIEHARDAGRAAGRAWIPTLVFTGGLRLGREGDEGYLAGLSLELPVFSRGQDLRAEARARAAHAAAEVASVRRDDDLAAARAAGELSASAAELRRLRTETAPRLERLERAAASGYREGELSLIELIDAGRARAEVARRLLALAWSARRAEVALRAARGELE